MATEDRTAAPARQASLEQGKTLRACLDRARVLAEAGAAWINEYRGVVLDRDEVYPLFENIAHSLEIADIDPEAAELAPGVIDALPAGKSKDRALIALKAAWEISAMAAAMLREIDHHNVESTLALRGMVIRVQDVATVVMNAMDDEFVALRDLRLALTGQHDASGEVAHG